MHIRDTPAQCNIGDGVLASNVRSFEAFQTKHTIVEFLPDEPFDLVQSGERPVARAMPTPWIFTLQKYNLHGVGIVDAWQREM